MRTRTKMIVTTAIAALALGAASIPRVTSANGSILAGSEIEDRAASTPAPNPALARGQIDAGRKAQAGGKVKEASLHYQAALEHDPASVDAATSFVVTAITLANEANAIGRHNEASQRLDNARVVLQTTSSQIMQATADTAAFSQLITAEGYIDSAEGGLRAAVNRGAWERLASAERHAAQAHYGWYSLQSNDRNEVREGMRDLVWIHERFNLADQGVRAEFHRVLQVLKSRISDEEYEPMRASAGFVATQAAN